VLPLQPGAAAAPRGPLAAAFDVGLVAMGAKMFAEWRTRGEMLQAAAATR
jgi:hypothetical protein